MLGKALVSKITIYIGLRQGETLVQGQGETLKGTLMQSWAEPNLEKLDFRLNP